MHYVRTSPESSSSSGITDVPAAPWTIKSVGYLGSRNESKAQMLSFIGEP